MGGRKSYNKEELADFIFLFIKDNGRIPERRDFECNKDYPSWRQYVREWGSWSRAIIELGYRSVKREKKKINKFICKICGKSFDSYSDSRKYCSIQCRDVSMSLKDSKKVSSNSYRRLAFRTYPWKCEICGYEEDVDYLYGKSKVKYPTILDVHHIDGNRNNNHYTNLTILCPLCHAKIHRKIYVNLRRVGIFNLLKYDKLSVEDYIEINNIKQKQCRRNSFGNSG